MKITDREPSRLERWDEWMDWPLIAAGAVFLLAYAVPIIYPDMGAGLRLAWDVVSWVTWALFVGDFLMRLALTDRRRRYFGRNLVEVGVIVAPLIPQLQLLRLVTVLRTVNRHGAFELRGKILTYLGGGVILLTLCGALAVLDAERANPDANIKNFGDAVWFGIVAITTAGFGDRYPTTGEGRVAASALLIGGVALFGSVASTLGTWFAAQAKKEVEEESAVIRRELAEIRSTLDKLAGTDQSTTSSNPSTPIERTTP